MRPRELWWVSQRHMTKGTSLCWASMQPLPPLSKSGQAVSASWPEHWLVRRTDLAVRDTGCCRTWVQAQDFSWLVLCTWEKCSKPQFPQTEVGQLLSRVLWGLSGTTGFGAGRPSFSWHGTIPGLHQKPCTTPTGMLMLRWDNRGNMLWKIHTHRSNVR